MVHISRAGVEFLRFYQATSSNIFNFCQAFNFTPTWQQAEPLRAVQGLADAVVPNPAARYLAIKSGQGPGKTTVVGIIALWRAWRQPGTATEAPGLTVVTAPTMRQIKEVFIAEVRSGLKRCLPDIQRFFEVRATEIEILGVEDWGIKTASASQADNMAGWHNPHLTFIVDEASGIERAIHETIMGTLTNVDKLYVMIGNPTKRDSPFFDCFNRDRKNWTRFTFNAEQSPIVDQANVRRLAELYGRDSDVYRVRVLGEFPLQDPNCVFSSDDLEACAQNNMLACARKSRAKQFGIDVAQFGDDDSTIYRRSGLAIVENRIFSKVLVDRVIGASFEMQKRAGWTDEETLYVIDTGGMGDGAVHHFHNRNKRVIPFKFNRTAIDSSQYDDRITEAFFGLQPLVRKREIYIPDDPQLITELSTRQYYLTLKGKLKLESKQDYKDRMQQGSPDRADGLVMSFYDEDAEAGRVAVSQRRRQEAEIS